MTLKPIAAALSLMLTVGDVEVANATACTSFGKVLKAQQSRGVMSVVIAPERLQKVVLDTEALTGVHTGAPTRGFLPIGHGFVVAGLEVDGCLLDPIYLAQCPRSRGLTALDRRSVSQRRVINLC